MNAFFRGVASAGFFKPETDKQVAGHANEFPENEHLEKIIREHDAEHGKREQAQECEEPRHAFVFVHVTERINVNRAALRR